MESNANLLGVIIEEGLKNVQGVKAVKIKDNPSYFICMWCAMKITVYEMPTVDVRGCSTWDDKLSKNEINLSCRVIDIFQLDEDLIYVMDTVGVLHSFNLVIHDTNSPMQFMEVDDLFSSPASCDTSSKWKENIVMQIKNCDHVIRVCYFTSGLAVLVRKDKCLAVHVYSLPDFRFEFFFDIHKYNSQDAVLSSCKIVSLSSSLKLYFQDNLEVLDEEIIIIGLSSGLVLWFCANNALKGPFVLFSAHHEVQRIHWIKDETSDLLTHLLIEHSSGSVVILGQEKITTLFLPDSVKASWCLGNHLITSNFADCYSSELKLTEEVDLNSVLLPIKGVCAMTESCDSNTLLLAATVHGSVYCLNITATSMETPTHFTIPEEHMLDNMLIQTKNLESIYKQLDEEDSILKAVSTTMAVNNMSGLFQFTLKVISDVEFCLETKLTKPGIVFAHKLWIANVEVASKNGYKESLYSKFTKDFSCDNKLQLSAKHNLSIGDVVSLELMLLIETQQPVLIVPIDKVEIDAGYLMIAHILVPNVAIKEDSFEDILRNLNFESSTKRPLQELKLRLYIPVNFSINSVLPSILHNSQHRIPKDEWDKLAVGKKHSIQINVNTIAILISLEVESRELTITSCDIQLCYEVKEAIFKRLNTPEDKYITENVALEVQALNQEFEIECFKDELDFQSLEIIRKKLRSTLSCHFLL